MLTIGVSDGDLLHHLNADQAREVAQELSEAAAWVAANQAS